MPRIYVEFQRLEQAQSEIDAISKKIDAIKSHFQSTVGKLDWDVKSKEDIERTSTALRKNLELEIKALKSYCIYIKQTNEQYIKLDQYNKVFDVYEKNKASSDVWDKIKSNLPKNVVLTPVEGEILKNSTELKNVKTITETLNIMKKLFQNHPIGSALSNLHKLAQITGELVTFYKDGNLDASDRAKVIDLGHELSNLLVNKDSEASSAGYGLDSSIQNLVSTIIASSDGMSNEEAVDFAENLVKTVGRGAEAILGGDPKARAICSVCIASYLGGYQIGESIKEYSADGSWNLSDTVNTGIDFLATIVHESVSEFSDGINDSAWTLGEIFSNSENPFDNRSNSQKLADLIKNVFKTT